MLRALVPEELVRAHRARALSPERPFIRGTAQNPDVYFQARETVNPFYARIPDVVEDAMARVGERTGRRLHIVDYTGHPDAERVLVIMGSGETAPTMIKPHRAIFERVGDRPAVLIDTPYGFQSNADDISARAVNYFAASVGREVGVVSWRTPPPAGCSASARTSMMLVSIMTTSTITLMVTICTMSATLVTTIIMITIMITVMNTFMIRGVTLCTCIPTPTAPPSRCSRMS